MSGQAVTCRIGRCKDQVQASEALPAVGQHRDLQGAPLFRLDLCVGGNFDAPAVARQLGIDRIASAREFPDAVRRVALAPSGPVKYQYLVVSENIDDVLRADLVVVQNFNKAKERLKKKIRAGAGLEVQVVPAKAMDARAAGRWIVQVRDLYRFCKIARCQMVVSSGAASMWEMVSGRSFDALLEECDINPERYWDELERWLESKLERRVTI